MRMGIIRKNLVCLVALCGVTLAAVSGCGDVVPLEDLGIAEVEFTIGAPETRSADESAVNHWSLFIFRTSDGGMELSASADGSGSITRSLPLDVEYRIYAAVNTPAGFNPSGIVTETDLFSKATVLDDNGSYFVMFGGGTYTIETGQTSQNIPVSRVACKLGVERVTVNLSDPYYASLPFVLKGVWPSNVYTRANVASDHSVATIVSAGASSWRNTMGVPSSFGVTGLNRTIAQGGGYDVDSYFYAYPNAIDSGMDTHAANWSPRCTRLVINASIGGTDYYYLVTIPSMVRNNSYVVTTCTITKIGSRDPEIPSEGAIDIVFSTDTDGWDGPVSVTEES